MSARTAGSAAPSVYVIHENPDWLPPIREAFAAEGVPLTEWSLTSGSIDLSDAPPEGVFWSRLSASAHTRGNSATKDYARAVFRWLAYHGRRVVNGAKVLELEVSKTAQHLALTAAGFDVPRTVAIFGGDDLKSRVREFPVPFISKHNQGGKGLGVRLFNSYDEFDDHLAGPSFEESPDGITLLQEYVRAAEPFITRAEFVGGKFLYAVRVDISGGSFELCPAEACAVPEPVLAGAACAVPGDALGRKMFERREDVTAKHPLIARLEKFLSDTGIEVAGIEFIETADGRQVVYDVNTNTNYNPEVEASAPSPGGREVAKFLGSELTIHYPNHSR